MTRWAGRKHLPRRQSLTRSNTGSGQSCFDSPTGYSSLGYLFPITGCLCVCVCVSVRSGWLGDVICVTAEQTAVNDWLAEEEAQTSMSSMPQRA